MAGWKPIKEKRSRRRRCPTESKNIQRLKLVKVSSSTQSQHKESASARPPRASCPKRACRQITLCHPTKTKTVQAAQPVAAQTVASPKKKTNEPRPHTRAKRAKPPKPAAKTSKPPKPPKPAAKTSKPPKPAAKTSKRRSSNLLGKVVDGNQFQDEDVGVPDKGRKQRKRKAKGGSGKKNKRTKKGSKNNSARQPKPVDVHDFISNWRKDLVRRNSAIDRLQDEINELATQRDAKVGRWQFHERRELQKRIDDLQARVAASETNEHVYEFDREARAFMKTFSDTKKQQEKEEKQDEEEAARRQEEEQKEHERLQRVREEEERLQRLREEEEQKENDRLQQLKDESPADRPINADAADVKATSNTVAANARDRFMPVSRQRHVTKPDQHVIRNDRSCSEPLADSFLAQFDKQQKPACVQPDKECKACGGELAHDVDADVLVCSACWNEQQTSCTSSRNIGYSNSDSVNVSSCRYKRESHFISHMQRFQGIVTTDKITDVILNDVMKFLIQSGITDVKKITSLKVDKALQATGYEEFRFCKIAITARITGEQPERFTPDEWNQMLDMFRVISEAFDVCKERGELVERINFMHYPSEMFRQLSLFSWGSRFIKHFRQRKFKGNEHAFKQDQLWKACVREAGLPFISTV